MPTLRETKTGGIIHFDAKDFLSGLSAQYITNLGSPGNYFSGQLMLASAFHPYRTLGYAAPGFDPTDLTNVSVVTGLLRNVCLGVESSVNYAYAIGFNELLHRIVISTKTISNSGSWPHTIVGTGAISGNDCVTYNSNVGGTAAANKKTNIFYSWNDAGGAWNVGMFNTASGVFDDDFMTTVPATPLSASGNTKPHPMIVGPDDLQYIADGNVLHSYDGSTGNDGTFAAGRLTLPSGYVITSMAKLPDYLGVFAYYSPAGPSVNPNVLTSGPAVCFLWNYLDLDITYGIPLNDNVVTAAFEFNGTIGCFTQGTKPLQEGENRNCTIQLLNGLNFEIKALFIGNPPIHGGVDVIDNSIQWNSDGAVHCFGSPLINTPSGLNILNKSLGSTSGVLRTIGDLQGFQLISSGATTTGGAQYFKIGTYGPASLMQTGTVSPDFAITEFGHITRVGIRFAQQASGGRALNAYLIKENGDEMQFISGLTDVTASNINTFFDKTVQDTYFGSFQDLGLILQWQSGAGGTNAPLVRSVDVEYVNKLLK